VRHPLGPRYNTERGRAELTSFPGGTDGILRVPTASWAQEDISLVGDLVGRIRFEWS
jgi:hypothetical protein